MPRRIDQYGESLIGPPTYAEWLSKEIGELLLAEGLHRSDGDANNLWVEHEGLTVWVKDYWNFMHKDKDRTVSNIALRNEIFYDAGFTPVLAVNIGQKDEQGKPVTVESYQLFRPKDIIPGVGFSNVFLDGLTDQQKGISDVILTARNGATARNPNDYPPISQLQEMLLPHTI
jgi:hypothetical protein